MAVGFALAAFWRQAAMTPSAPGQVYSYCSTCPVCMPCATHHAVAAHSSSTPTDSSDHAVCVLSQHTVRCQTIPCLAWSAEDKASCCCSCCTSSEQQQPEQQLHSFAAQAQQCGSRAGHGGSQLQALSARLCCFCECSPAPQPQQCCIRA